MNTRTIECLYTKRVVETLVFLYLYSRVLILYEHPNQKSQEPKRFLGFLLFAYSLSTIRSTDYIKASTTRFVLLRLLYSYTFSNTF